MSTAISSQARAWASTDQRFALRAAGVKPTSFFSSFLSILLFSFFLFFFFYFGWASRQAAWSTFREAVCLCAQLDGCMRLARQYFGM